jgi:hypothetical protein
VARSRTMKGAGAKLPAGTSLLTGSHADMLLGSLPPIVHTRKESDKAAMRWSLERMREELRDPQPGGSLIAQTRLHDAHSGSSTAFARWGEKWRRLALRLGR